MAKIMSCIKPLQSKLLYEQYSCDDFYEPYGVKITQLNIFSMYFDNLTQPKYS